MCAGFFRNMVQSSILPSSEPDKNSSLLTKQHHSREDAGHEILNVTPQGPISQSIESDVKSKYNNKKDKSNWYRKKARQKLKYTTERKQ